MITHVAIRYDGKVWSLPKPNRHHDVFRLIHETTGVWHINIQPDDQGFLDDLGQYLRRKPACFHADKCGQLNVIRPKTSPPDTLFSEDVW